MIIRKSNIEDIPAMLEIYEYARQFMRDTGNPTQWGDSYPELELLEGDIVRGESYVVVAETEELTSKGKSTGAEENENCNCLNEEEKSESMICGTFMLKAGADPTYAYIEDGSWIDDSEYMTIHRIASNGKAKGVFREAVKFGLTQIDNLRIDTHADNKVMQSAILGAGFQRCGIIYVDDGSARIAYQMKK